MDEKNKIMNISSVLILSVLRKVKHIRNQVERD